MLRPLGTIFLVVQLFDWKYWLLPFGEYYYKMLQIWGSDVICGIVNMFSAFLISFWKLLLCWGKFLKLYFIFSIIFDLDLMFFLAYISFSAFFFILLFDELYLFFFELFLFFYVLVFAEFFYLDNEFDFFLIITGFPHYIIFTHWEIEFFYYFFDLDFDLDFFYFFLDFDFFYAWGEEHISFF